MTGVHACDVEGIPSCEASCFLSGDGAASLQSLGNPHGKAFVDEAVVPSVVRPGGSSDVNSSSPFGMMGPSASPFAPLLEVVEPTARTAEEKSAFLEHWPSVSLQQSSADYYFNSYNHYGVHEDLLKDTPTMFSYQRAIRQNAHLFRDAVVLDVGAGLGICALLAAQAGAKRVIALETQSELVSMGSRVAQHNGFGPDKLTFVLGDAMSLDRLPGDIQQVDIIVSEWMGYCLMYEARLGDVLRARDRWLRPGGLMFPDRAKLHMALLDDSSYKTNHFDYFDNVWGFNYAAMKAHAHIEPVVSHFAAEQLISNCTCVLDLNLLRCSADDCYQMAAKYQLTCKRDGQVNAALLWFEILFEACHKPIGFGTGPDALPTCWKQTAFFLGSEGQEVRRGDRVRGAIAVKKPSESRRHLDVKISCGVNSRPVQLQYYRWT